MPQTTEDHKPLHPTAQPEEVPTAAQGEALDPKHDTPVMSPALSFTLGVIFMLLSGLGFAAQGLFVNLADGIPSFQKTLARNIVLFIVAFGVWFARRRKDIAHHKPLPNRKKNIWILILRSTLGTLGVLANFYALSHIPIANAQLLNKLSPFFTIIFTTIFMKQRVNKAQWLGIVMAFIGVVVLLNPDAKGVSAATALPIALGIAGGIFAGAAYASVHYLTHEGVDSSFIIMFFAGFSAISILPLVIPTFTAMTPQEWLYMLLIGVFALVGQYGITYAYRFAEPRRVSIFDYSAVIFSMVLGLIFLNQVPGPSAIIGNVIIFAAFLMMFLYNRRHARNGTERSK